MTPFQKMMIVHAAALVSAGLATAADLDGLKASFLGTEKASKPQGLLSVGQVQEMLQISRISLWAWAKSGKLRTVKLGSRVRYRLEDIQSMIEAGRS